MRTDIYKDRGNFPKKVWKEDFHALKEQRRRRREIPNDENLFQEIISQRKRKEIEKKIDVFGPNKTISSPQWTYKANNKVL